MDNFLTFRWFFEKSGSIRLLALVHVRLMTRSKNERISQFQKIDRTVVLETLFELRIDDVICMTHQRKVLKMKVQTQYFMNINREIHLGSSIWFWDHFKKSKEFYQNIKTRTVSLKLFQVDFCLMVATVLISTSVCETASIVVKMLRNVFYWNKPLVVPF